jgi:signal transduction histidine kinase
MSEVGPGAVSATTVRPLDVDGIVEATVQRLNALDLPLPVVVDEECRQIIEAIVHEVSAELPTLAAGGTGPVMSYVADARHVEFGALQSQRASHPAESLIVADILFDSALPQFIAWAGQEFGYEPVEVVRVLHHVIWRRFPAGAIGYTEGLRQRLFAADRESRLRVSRDLHDRVAHGLAAAIQRVELGMGEADGTTRLNSALEILRSSLEEVRSIATDLRRHVGDRTLEESLRSLADEIPQDSTPLVFEVTGPSGALTAVAGEEAYLVALEAIRNAREHAVSANRILVSLKWDRHELILRVIDDGAGIDSRRRSESRGLGLQAMHERALALGGILSIASKPGQGTVVELVVPLLGVGE